MPFQPHKDGVRISLRANPGSSRNALTGVHLDAAGQKHLKACVTAVAEGGKANKAVIAMLSKTWRQPKSAFSILSGDTGKQKTLLLHGNTDKLMQTLTGWLAATFARPP